MVIYGEYLFMENFITGGILLLFTGKLLKCRISKIRLIIGAGVCGVGGFVIFLPMSPTVGIFLRIGIAGVAVLSALGGAKSPKAMVAKTSIFMALTLISGGVVMALTLWREVPSVSGAGALYIPPLSYLRLFCFGTLAFGFSYLLIGFLRRVRVNLGLCDRAEVEIDGKKLSLKAMVDTGNYLKEPFSGKPVALIAMPAAKKLGEFGKPESPESLACRQRYTLVPFRTVGSQRGMLAGVRTDRICFRGKEVKNAVIAFYDGDFEESELILGRDFLENDFSEGEFLERNFLDRGISDD